MIRAILVAAWCGSLAMQPPQLPPRDTRPRTGETPTASISGTVLSDESQPRKLRRARVTINGAFADGAGQTVITDDEGRFRFTALPPGQYGLIAVKDGYVSARYGSARPVRAFNPRTTARTGISVHAGDHVTADIRLARGAVITGVVIGADGRPEEGVLVTASTYEFVPGANERVLTGRSSFATDDRGRYRIYGLHAGEYTVTARERSVGAEPPLALSSTGSRSVVAAPIYFPSTTDPNSATRLRLTAGEERDGVDIQMQYAPVATISGVVSVPAGFVAGYVALTRPNGYPGATGPVAGVSLGEGGAFALPNVVPGHYILFAIARSGPPNGSQPDAPSTAGSLEIDVDGEDVTSVIVPMTPTFSLSGRLVLEGTGGPLPRIDRLPLPMAPAVSAGAPPPSYFHLADESHFTITGLIAGPYRVGRLATVPGIRAPLGKWWLKSILVGGRETLDGPIEIRGPGEDAVVTLSDRASAVSGAVRDMVGSPVPEVFVAIYASDRDSWFPNSRRVAAVRTDALGHYTVRNLPPGEYRAAVALDLEQGEWFDPDVLQGLLATAVTLTISGTEAKTLDLTLR